MSQHNGAGHALLIALHRKQRKMQTKQSIAIVGATGSMGAAISEALAKGPFRLLLHAPKKDKLKTLTQKIRKAFPSAEVEAIDCSFNASWEADIIILAVPYDVEKELALKIKQVANQKIVVSISNPLNHSYDRLVTAPGSSAAEELQKLLPNSKVVKAFNTTFAASFHTPVIDRKRLDAFIAGNDPEAVDTVKKLVETAGFNPVLAGGLDVSSTLEGMQLLLIRLRMRNQDGWEAGWKILHR